VGHFAVTGAHGHNGNIFQRPQEGPIGGSRHTGGRVAQSAA
jgi:hypothetical protein